MYAATASFRSSRPVNGSQLLASSSPTAARVASTASSGGGMSVSRFSRRRTSGSSPAAAATRSMLKPGMWSSRLTGTVPQLKPRLPRRGVGDRKRRREAGNGQPHAAPRGMAVGLRQKVGRTDEQEEAGVEREQVAEPALRYVDSGADDCAEQRRDRVDQEPDPRASPVAALPQDEADGVHPICEVEDDEQAGRRADVKGEPDPETVDEAVQRQAGRTERADPGVRARLLGFVAVMQDEHPLDEEEADEPRSDERRDATRRIECFNRLRQDVEQRDRDDDPAGESNQRRDLALETKRHEPADQRGEEGRHC